MTIPLAPWDQPAFDGGPKVRIVSSAEVAEQDTLNARYWVDRQPGESYGQWRLRKETEDMERRAADHEDHARRLRAEAARLRGGGA